MSERKRNPIPKVFTTLHTIHTVFLQERNMRSDIEHIACEIIKSSFTYLTIFLQERNPKKSGAMMFSLCLHAKPQLLSELATMFPSSFFRIYHIFFHSFSFRIHKIIYIHILNLRSSPSQFSFKKEIQERAKRDVSLSII